jgi:hypothetical protein
MKKLIQSFEHACEIMGEDPSRLPDVAWMPETRGNAFLADYKLMIITKAQNILDKFVPDYGNRTQWKYSPWFEWVASRSAFVSADTTYTNTGTALGSRFCFVDTKTARHIGETFIDLYNDVMLDTLIY